MAYEKTYNPTEWVDNETPINQDNLNKIEEGLDTLDDRIVTILNSDQFLSVAFEESDTIGVELVADKEVASNFSEYTHTFDTPFTGELIVGLEIYEDIVIRPRFVCMTYNCDNELVDYFAQANTGDVEEVTRSVEGIAKIVIKTSDDYNIKYLRLSDGKTYRFNVKENYALQSDLDDLSLIVGQANTVLESV